MFIIVVVCRFVVVWRFCGLVVVVCWVKDFENIKKFLNIVINIIEFFYCLEVIKKNFSYKVLSRFKRMRKIVVER